MLPVAAGGRKEYTDASGKVVKMVECAPLLSL
jgi:hypothetical protein